MFYAPLYSALKEYADSIKDPLHMPGHIRGRGYQKDAAQNGLFAAGGFFPELAAAGLIDFTEVPGLDDLHLPDHVIREAMELAAGAWGAARSLFLVNGATSGLHALLLALGESKVLVARNCHRAVLGGLILSGGQPVYLPCTHDEMLGIALSVAPRAVEEACYLHPDAKAMIMVSPCYYGAVGDIAAVCRTLEPGGIPLIVDEAHGGHFAFAGTEFPASALQCGAAAAVHGLHKTMPVLTQAGLLHFSADFTWTEPAVRAYDLLTTTSPSYLLMSSIDAGRAIMQERGKALLSEAADRSAACRRAIGEIPGFRCRGAEYTPVPGIVHYDPLKVLIEIDGLGANGVEIDQALRREYGIQTELAAGDHLLAMFSPFHPPEAWTRLVFALQEIAVKYCCGKRARQPADWPAIPKQAATPREAFLAKHKTVMIKEAAGLVCAEAIAPYPPGIPVIMPGELIGADIVEYLGELRQRGTGCHGASDPALRTITVID